MIDNGDRRSVLEAHAAECDECGSDAPALDRLAMLLNRSAVRIDIAALSQRTLAVLKPELARQSRRVLMQRVLIATLLA